MSKKIAILIDGARQSQMATALNLFVDYNKLAAWAADFYQGDVVIKKFFTQTPGGEHPIYKRIDFLKLNGWEVVERLANMRTNGDGHEHMVGSMDSHMVAEMVSLSYEKAVDHVIIFSGSTDLVPGIEALRKRYITVSALGLHNKGLNGPADRSFMMHDFRMAVSGGIVELSDVYDEIGSEKQERAPR